MAAPLGRSATLRQGVLYPPIRGTAALTLSGYDGFAASGAIIRYTLKQGYNFFSLGTTGGAVNGVVAVYSGNYSGQAEGGAQARGEYSGYSFTLSGTTQVVARATLTLSGYSGTIHGATDAVGRAAGTLQGDYTGTLTGGAQARGTYSGYSFTSHGVRDSYARVVGTIPRAQLVITGSRDNYGSVVGTLPSLVATPSARVVATLPRGQLVIVGTTAGSLTPLGYEAYSFHFEKDTAHATHYTNYPFDQIIRLGNTYYGVAADGLFELGGNTFDGTPIVAVVQTAPTDFKSRELKRPFSLYMGGRVGADFRVSVVSAEIDVDSYVYRPVDKTGARNYRVLFGKGIRARYLAYMFTNIDGGDFELDDFTPEIAVLRRTA